MPAAWILGYLLFFCLTKVSLMVVVVESKVRVDARNSNTKEGEEQPLVVPEFDPNEPKEPHFAEDSPKQVVASVGSPAHIPCKPRNLGAKSVSWIRHRDLHVLTVGSFTFTNDERFSAHRDATTGDWILVIRRPTTADSGFYDCSISTKPVTAIAVKLNVVVPTVELLGDGEIYLDRGSTLNLTCVVHFTPTPPEFVLWYHRDKLVNYGKPGRAISVETTHDGDTTRSSLLVHNATMWDSGKYACKPSNAPRVARMVHVLRGETPAAMQTTTSSAQCARSSLPLFLSFHLLISLSSFFIPYAHSLYR
ncbi:zwei Ig domain protein zig-8-like [Palaemon carinicauda]|uniref:zwei Ig domain protein zig-8-like n=1 Tax=Palaemon carinicauda TaxID=392227 RepID=UPI0035B67E55